MLSIFFEQRNKSQTSTSTEGEAVLIYQQQVGYDFSAL